MKLKTAVDKYMNLPLLNKILIHFNECTKSKCFNDYFHILN